VAAFEVIISGRFWVITKATFGVHPLLQGKCMQRSIAEYFRMCVGLIPETKHPLLETELLGACRLINT
jgi:hypothetical protein